MDNNNSFEKLKEAAEASLKNPGKALALPKAQNNVSPTVFIFRHSQTFDNIRRIFSGRRNSHLTKEGIEQAKNLSIKLKNEKIDLIYSSPQIRCVQTAEEVLRFHPGVQLIKDPLLLERDYGVLTGKSKNRLMKIDPKMTVLYRRSYDVPPPEGESIKDVWEGRIKKFCQELEEKIKKESINVAICCTNNTMRVIRMYFEKLSIEDMLTLENPFNDFASYNL